VLNVRATFNSRSFLVFDLFNNPVEIALKEPVLYDSIFFEFAFGKGLGDLLRDLAGIIKDFLLIELEKGVPLLGPIVRGQLIAIVFVLALVYRFSVIRMAIKRS